MGAFRIILTIILVCGIVFNRRCAVTVRQECRLVRQYIRRGRNIFGKNKAKSFEGNLNF